jgi:hypothetical protein
MKSDRVKLQETRLRPGNGEDFEAPDLRSRLPVTILCYLSGKPFELVTCRPNVSFSASRPQKRPVLVATVIGERLYSSRTSASGNQGSRGTFLGRAYLSSNLSTPPAIPTKGFDFRAQPGGFVAFVGTASVQDAESDVMQIGNMGPGPPFAVAMAVAAPESFFVWIRPSTATGGTQNCNNVTILQIFPWHPLLSCSPVPGTTRADRSLAAKKHRRNQRPVALASS